MPDKKPTVYIVDRRPQFRESMSTTVRSMGLNAAAYPSAEAFLDGYSDSPDSPKCMVLDVALPGLSGLGLQQVLAADGKGMPIIMVSGCADIPMAVQAMRPVRWIFWRNRSTAKRCRSAFGRPSTMTFSNTAKPATRPSWFDTSKDSRTRQREVLDLLVAGERSKQIARQLGIGEKTVAKHRAAVLEKMQVDSVIELVRLFADAHPTVWDGTCVGSSVQGAASVALSAVLQP